MNNKDAETEKELWSLFKQELEEIKDASNPSDVGLVCHSIIFAGCVTTDEGRAAGDRLADVALSYQRALMFADSLRFVLALLGRIDHIDQRIQAKVLEEFIREMLRTSVPELIEKTKAAVPILHAALMQIEPDISPPIFKLIKGEK